MKRKTNMEVSIFWPSCSEKFETSRFKKALFLRTLISHREILEASTLRLASPTT